MILKERTARLLLNLFPPLLFSRVRIKEISGGYRKVIVKVNHSRLNRNFQKSIFGGSIFSAADPVYAIMYWQIFAHKGYKAEVWLKSASIEYVQPARKDLWLTFSLTDAEIQSAEEELKASGKITRTHTTEVLNTDKEICATIQTTVVLRLSKEKDSGSF